MLKDSKFLVVGTMDNQTQKFGPKTRNSVPQAFLGPKISRMSNYLNVFMKQYCQKPFIDMKKPDTNKISCFHIF